MSNKKISGSTVKYTFVLPSENIEKLKVLTRNKRIKSVNSAVKEAIEEYLKRVDDEDYMIQLQEAAKDPEFIRRTGDTEKFYYEIDKETEGMMGEW